MKAWLRRVLGLIAMTAVTCVHGASAHDVGLRKLSILAPNRAAAIDLLLWYPAKPDGMAESFGASKIFKGVIARRDATPAEGAFPVLLLAAGGLRSNPTLAAWLAGDLAARGYFVAAPLPPPLGPDDAARAVREIWLRPGDLTAALTAVAQDPIVTAHMDPDRTAVLGLFLGGTSALTLAGARLDANHFKALCDNPPLALDCRWFAKGKVDLHTLDATPLAASHRDARILAAIAINPELATSLAPDSLSEITVPIQILNLGSADDLPPSLDASSLEHAIPGAAYTSVPQATPFSAFSECTPEAAAILAEDGEDETICIDAGSRSRAELHQEISDLVANALAQVFKAPP